MSSSVGTDEPGLHLAIESGLPAELAVGRGNLLTVYGWCFHDRAEIRRLELLVDGAPQPVIAHGMPRPDVVHRLSEAPGGPANAYRSGFWGMLKLAEVEAPREVEIAARAQLRGGGSATAAVGRMRLLPGERKAWRHLNGGQPQVAICMATFNPPPDLFARQIESIRAQTYENWVCLISDDDSHPDSLELIERLVGDDPRFRVERHAPRLGYYRNFERALEIVPAEAGLVALSDQDDHWHPDKLASLVEEFSEGVTLAFSDARVIDEEGNTLSETFWSERANNTDDLGALLLVNSITGGAALFRSDLLDYVLPFPTPPEGGLHDHWVGMVALALGKLAYVERPLYDYVQHGSAALGHESLRRPVRNRKGLARLRALRNHSAFRNALAGRVSWMRMGYPEVLGVRASAELILLRGDRAIERRKRRVLRRCARLELSPSGWAWLMARSRIGRAKTLGSERFLVAGSLWRVLLGAVKALRLPPPPPDRETLSAMLKLPLASTPPAASRLQRLIAPIPIEASPEAPSRVNVLVPTIDLEHFFGDYLARFNLARRLAQSGSRVRVVTVDEPFYLAPTWRADLERFAGLGGLGERVEIELAHDRSRPLQVSPDDRFVATSWWTAHIAHHAARQLGGERFLYLISECEQLRLPMGSESALAAQSYEFPHFALFSTELLRDYFRRQRLGVFAGDAGEEDSAAFENAITVGGPPSEAQMRSSERKLLFHTRPELHAERSMFELGLLALSAARDAGALEGWVLDGIGAQQAGEVRYGDGLRVKIGEQAEGDAYADLLRKHAVGLSLMMTPHPGQVALDMAAAGMTVVTNTFENKTAEALAAISANLVAVKPTIEGIGEGVKAAIATSFDHERRARGAEVNWSRSWDESFNAALIERLRAFMDRA